MDDIARSAGVSRTTVSYVLNDRQRAGATISEETRNRVLEVAEQMDYRTNQLARAIVKGKSRVFGVTAQDMNSENRTRILSGMLAAATEGGYLIKILQLSNVASPRDIIHKCREWSLAGLLGNALLAEEIEVFHKGTAELGIPLAITDTTIHDKGNIQISSDDAQSFELLLDHLCDLGHRDIAFLGGLPDTPITQRREACFRHELHRRGLPVREEAIQSSHWGDLSVMEASAREILSLNPRPTAVVCAGDPLGMALIRVASQMKIAVPEEVSVTGYANFYLSQFSNPSITTIDQDFEEMGRRAVRHLIRFTEAQPFEQKFVCELLPTRLTVRESTAPPPKSGS